MALTSCINHVINHPIFADIQKFMTLIASIAVIIGIFIAAYQIKISTDNNIRQTTLDILKPTREEAVLLAFQRLGFAKDTKKPLEDMLTERATIERDLILNTYDSVAIHYKFGTIDKCIVKAHVKEALDQAIEILNYLNVPSNKLSRLTQLQLDLDALVCAIV